MQFDYKKEYQRTWIYYIVGSLVGILLLTTTYMFYDFFDTFTTFDLVHFYASYIFQFFELFAVSISYIILLENLHRRFVAQNSILRFSLILTRDWIRVQHSINLTLSWNRNRFMIGHTMKLSITSHKDESVKTIKFIGRQHSFLIDIMDNVNSCYSFQVFWFVILVFQLNSRKLERLIIIQVMFTTAYTFAYSVLGFYTCYRYIREKSELYKDQTWVHFKWQLYFLAIVLRVIYTAQQLSSEVFHIFVFYLSWIDRTNLVY